MSKDALKMQVFAHWERDSAQTTKALPTVQSTSIPAAAMTTSLAEPEQIGDHQRRTSNHQHHLLQFQLLDS